MAKIKVLRGFVYNGDPQEAGTELDVPDAFAQEMVSLNKALRVDKQGKATPLSTKTAGQLVPGQKDNESTDATPTETVPGSTAEEVERSRDARDATPAIPAVPATPATRATKTTSTKTAKKTTTKTPSKK